jgi:hypothetical protein
MIERLFCLFSLCFPFDRQISADFFGFCPARCGWYFFKINLIMMQAHQVVAALDAEQGNIHGVL